MTSGPLFVVDEGLGAHGTADHTVRVGSVTAWVSGWTPAGVDALAHRAVERGLEAIASWPGDWAIVLKRDAREGLQVAVDPYAGRVLYTDGVTVAEAPEDVTDLRTLPVDEAGMAVQLSGWVEDPTTTLVQGIWRVPAGYGGAVSASRVRLARIWVPEPRPSERPVLELRTTVEAVVRDRLARSREPVTALSGGLDSSVLAGVVTTLLPNGAVPKAVCNRFAGWEADEGPWIDAVSARHGLHTVHVDSRELDPLEVLERLAPPGFPPLIVNHHLNLALLRNADGPLWTGFGGDEVFGHGLDLVRELAEDGRTLRAAWEAFWLARRYRHVRMSQTRALRMWTGRWVRAMLPDRSRVRVAGRPRGTLQRRFETATHPLVARSREEQQRLARSTGTSIEMPLLDPRIASLCLAIPARRLVRRGRTRFVVREAFADLLPPTVARRADKSDLSRAFDQPLSDRSRSASALEVDAQLLAPWVDAPDIEACRSAAEEGSHRAWCALFRMVGASRWLQWHTGGVQGSP